MTKDEIVVGRGGRDYWTDLETRYPAGRFPRAFRLRRDAASGQFFLKDLSRLGTTINGEAAPSSIEFAGGEKRDRNVEAPVPEQARIGLAGVLFWNSEARASGRERNVAMVKTKLKSAGASDPGRVRQNNEDALYIDAERGIFLVVDGIGGQAAGEKAAEIAVECVRARLERQTGTAEQRIREAIAIANNEILRQAPRQPGVGRHGLRAHSGGARERLGRDRPRGRFAPVPDSRAAPSARSRTTIRRWARREDAGELSEAEAMRHPRRNEVFRDVGSEEHAPGDAGFIEIAAHSLRRR